VKDKTVRFRTTAFSMTTKYTLLAAIIGCIFSFALQPAAADAKIKYCTFGTITLGPFPQHLEELRKAKRYSAEDIDKLIADQKAGGPDFDSTQVVIKEEQSGSGDFDLNLFQGYMDPATKFHNQMKWACTGDDYPVAYFVGFKVRDIRDGAIYVSRQKGTVNVISLKAIDPKLDKHTSVKDFQDQSVLCQDIGTACIKQIFYGRY
jgi:hypothetical protein